MKLDNLLDNELPDADLVVNNINEMFMANLTVIRFPQSQNIINAEVFKAIRTEKHGRLDIGQIEHGIQEENRGTLYYRLCSTPKLYGDRAERHNYYK